MQYFQLFCMNLQQKWMVRSLLTSTAITTLLRPIKKEAVFALNIKLRVISLRGFWHCLLYIHKQLVYSKQCVNNKSSCEQF